jgi:hypothetical protein
MRLLTIRSPQTSHGVGDVEGRQQSLETRGHSRCLRATNRVHLSQELLVQKRFQAPLQIKSTKRQERRDYRAEHHPVAGLFLSRGWITFRASRWISFRASLTVRAWTAASVAASGRPEAAAAVAASLARSTAARTFRPQAPFFAKASATDRTSGVSFRGSKCTPHDAISAAKSCS